MQNPRQLTRHKQRHQKAKTTGKQRNAKTPTYLQQQQTQHQDEDQNIQRCVDSIFLYNSELWTLTKTAENKIDSYHRRILRRAINVRWPNKISCEDLYNKTKQETWSGKIKTQRMRWYGHVIRLPEEAPAKLALQEAGRKVKKLRGGKTTTWFAVLQKRRRHTGPHSRWSHRTSK